MVFVSQENAGQDIAASTTMQDMESSVEVALQITTSVANHSPVTVWDQNGRTWFIKLVCF